MLLEEAAELVNKVKCGVDRLGDCYVSLCSGLSVLHAD